MNETFTQFLNELRADPDLIHQALRIHVSERSDDLTHNEMISELRESVGHEEELQELLKHLEHDQDGLEQAALIYFESAWEDDLQKPSIRSAFRHAKNKLPVIEIAILAVVAMYGMHLIATHGVLEKIIKRKPDGSYEETEKREPFAPVVSAMVRLLATKTG